MTPAEDLTGFVPSFLSLARAQPDRHFARFAGEPVSFGRLLRESGAIARMLRQRGLRLGDRVGVMQHNSLVALPTLYALARAGLIWVPVNAQLRGDGLRYILEHCAPSLVIADDEMLPVIAASGAALSSDAIGVGEVRTWLDADGADAMGGFDEAPPPPDDTFAIMYTSGTTGPPKGAIVSHRMLRLAGEGVRWISDVSDGDVLFVWEPLYHIGGAQLLVVPLLRRAVLAMVPRFSASRFWDEVRENEATHIHFLGGILQILLKQPENPRDREHRVRIAWGGGCPAQVWRPFEERFGVRIRECYGMTEASSITTWNDSGVVGAVGRPVPWFSVELLDPEGRDVAPGERGEIVVRTTISGAIFPGYFRNPDATARALRDGALFTGDVGSFAPDGNLILHGRLSDSVRCRGENVSAWEVEHVVADHPDVEDSAMIGVAAEVGEQDIKLFVQPKAGQTVDPAALSTWLAKRLAPYQNPRYIAVVASFERTPSLRIMKHKLSRATDDGWDRLRGTG